MCLIKIRNLSLKYEEYLFKNLNLDINPRDRIVIIGPSGSGKSSLLKAILRQIKYEGKISFKEGVKVSYMPQNLALLPHKTVQQNIELPLKIKKKIINISPKLYQKFGLEKHLNKYPKQLSGGQAQRVSLMRAIVDNCEVLCIDEPLSKLDQITKIEMIDFFKENFQTNSAVLYITHDLMEAQKISTKIIVINKKITIINNEKKTMKMDTLLMNLIKNSN
ncbi:MAG: ATP-binding cassette domain-containing protein [Mycoplasmatales bacterium]